MASSQVVRIGTRRAHAVAIGLTIVSAAALTGCGSAGPPAATEVDAVLSCEDDFKQIVELLRSCIPTYDYEPAVDLADLIDRTDAALTGTIDRIVRTRAPEPNMAGDDSWTTMSTGNVELLAGHADLSNATIAQSSLWTVRGEPDPLADPIDISGLGFVAFVHAAPSVPGGLSVDVQGLFVSCTRSTSSATAILEPLPEKARALTLTELVRAVSDAG